MNLLRFMPEKLRRALGIKSPSQKKFTVDLLSGPVEGLAKYPPKVFAGEERIYAYRMWLSVADASGVVACLRTNFPSVDSGVVQRGMHIASNGESLYLAVYPEFGDATTVMLLTNSVDLLRAIDALNLAPPPPWKLFPHLEPDFKGAMQGEFDYWWGLYWKPFWDAASSSEREQYMQLHQPSEAWLGYLEFRDLLVSSEFLAFLDRRIHGGAEPVGQQNE